jgi:hypothetical protein
MVATIQNNRSMHLLSAHLPSALNQSEPRHVKFQEHVTVIQPSNSLNDIDSGNGIYSSWYQLNELDSFRNDARELCREMRYHDTLVTYADSSTSSSDSDSSTHSAPAIRLPSMARNSSTRGLEQRTCDERQRRKYLANRFILKIAPRLYLTDPDKLAEVSQKCNAWATELAIEEAARDFERVYARSEKKRRSFESVRIGAKRIRIQ